MSEDSKIQKAILVGVHLQKVSDEEFSGSLEELERLVKTLGYKVIGQLTQKRSSAKSGALLGEGKLKELASWTGGRGVVTSSVEHKLSKAALKWKENDEDEEEEATDEAIPEEREELAEYVIVDTDLSPSQIRNLENATDAKVLDRTGVIIEIFSRHARTKAAKIQVEMARLAYVAPRLRETGGDTQQGGGGKGAGESSLELDKRRIRDRLKELRTELAAIGNVHEVRRARRAQEISVALVGYTNAGKSSLMRVMTGSEVLIADKLFATLDTTVRPMYPETRPKVLLSDTVGFIKKLPHDLVASFKSTLDEALNASLLLFVVDSADPSFRSQLEVTKSVLNEVGASEIPSILVLNKRDRLNETQIKDLEEEFPDAIMISTRNKDDLQVLRNLILSFFEKSMEDDNIFVPYDVKGIIGEIRGKMRVLDESYDEKGVTLKVRSSKEAIEQIRKKLFVD